MKVVVFLELKLEKIMIIKENIIFVQYMKLQNSNMKKNKVGTNSPVLQLSPTKSQGLLADRNYSDFINKNSTKYSNVKLVSKNNHRYPISFQNKPFLKSFELKIMAFLKSDFVRFLILCSTDLKVKLHLSK